MYSLVRTMAVTFGEREGATWRAAGGPPPEFRRRGHPAAERRTGIGVARVWRKDHRGWNQVSASEGTSSVSAEAILASGQRHRLSSSSRIRSSDFPSLSDSARIGLNKKSFSPPFVKHDLSCQLAIQKGEFPFDEVDVDTVRIKSTPIQLQWNLYDHSKSIESKSNNSSQFNQIVGLRNYEKQRWFRKPPKVRVVPGILGSYPVVDTRGNQLHRGENSGERDPESGHSPLQDSKNSIRVGGDPTNPRNPNFLASARVNLSRFVGHLWTGAKPRSFAAVVRANPAPTVVVEMQPRGGGRQGGFSGRGTFGQDRGGFGYGRAGFGQGRGGFGLERGGYGQGRGGFNQDRGRFGPGFGQGNSRGGGRFNSWRRKDEGSGNEEKNEETLAGKESQALDSEEIRDRWEGKSKLTGDKQMEENPSGPDLQKEEASKKESKMKSLDIADSSLGMGKSVYAVCEFCGLSNHATQDCRRMLCEICGFTNQNTYD